MDLVGEFQKVEIDGKPFLVYHNVVKPLPQIHTPNSSKVAIDSSGDLPPQPLFLCPKFRTKPLSNLRGERNSGFQIFAKYNISPLFNDTSDGHHVLPLFWCNNKEGDECDACGIQTIDTDYYFCVECDKRFHKTCVESPLEISYPSHANHSLQLYFSRSRGDDCSYCRGRIAYMLYYCALCKSYMHVLCAQEKIPFFIDQPKRHNHTLTLFPRQASLTCNLCGWVGKLHLTYVCPMCDFVAHSDCIDNPQTIRISRHHHRVSFISSIPFQEKSCGVCRQKIGNNYGAYICNLCSGYAVHTKCAMRKDIWDGIELEGVPEEDEDIKLEPFEIIEDGVILHFSHSHHLRFETSGVYDANKLCQACILPVYQGNLYVCVQCDFILHETCAEAPRKKYHPLHPHPLQLETIHKRSLFYCSACNCGSNGFVYRCRKRKCPYDFELDFRCALVSEPFKYKGHQHSLFLSLDPTEKPMCHVCKLTGILQKVINCIECDFIVCFRCATLPYKARYKHDEHYLTFCHGDEANDSDWCEVCEGKLAVGGSTRFYKCDEYCCTTVHMDCLLGPSPYMKPGQPITHKTNNQVLIFRNNSVSRPICINCIRRCPYPMFVTYNRVVMCSSACIRDYVSKL